MIIESLTAFGAGKIVWETLEILHLVHVGHIAGKASYKGGSSITHGIQQQLKKWQDKINPGQRYEREAETPYDFESIDDATYQKIKKQAEAYLTTLKGSVWNLNNAKKYFSKTHGKLKKLANALDEHQFSSQLLKFKINFESFKDEFNQFLLSIKTPPRQLLYIADLSNKEGGGVIKQFNGYLESIKACLEELEKTKKDIVDELKKGFDLKPTLFPATSSSSALSEQLQQNIEQCMHNSEQLSETMPAILSENTELATLRTAITQLSTPFQQTDTIKERTARWENNPNWIPLLTEEKQIEAGQRIFLHAMSEMRHSGEEKLLLAQIFLRQHVSKYVLNQVTIELLAHELARLLRVLQIKKCEQLAVFLRTLTQGAVLPEHDSDGLLEWLKTKRRDQSSIELFIEVLVSPYCFSQFRLESAVPRLKDFLYNQAVNELIRDYKKSYWGAIREKSDTLIQLPKSFDAKILPRDCIVEDEQAKNSSVVSDVIHELAKKLITDLETLKAELQKHHAYLQPMVTSFYEKKEEASKLLKDLEHENGVARIKKFHRYIHAIISPSNSLFPYLYHAETINEVEKKQQVATIDDLLYVIYRGVNPNGVCFWKASSSQPYSESNQLLYYFLQNQQDESRTKACIYAFRDCQANSVPLFGNSFFSPADCRLLALENTPESTTENTSVSPENTLSIDIILKDPNKISSIPIHSKALNDVSPKTKEEAETAFKQLQDYQVLALTRINPAYRNKLPFMQQLKCLIKNLFKSTQDIRQERLESVRIFIGDLCVVLSAEDAKAMSQALDDFKKNYEGRFKEAKKVYKSVLYTTMLRLIDGPISVLIGQLPEAEQKQFKIEENKIKLKERVTSLQETLNKVEQDKAEIEAKLKESEAQRVRDKAESEAKLKEYEVQRARDKAESEAKLKEYEAKRAQDKVEMEAKMNKLFAHFTSQQPAANSLASDADTSESSSIRFFKS